jgi:hypothetical protein
LDYDTQHSLKELNRNFLLEFLEISGFVEHLHLPLELAFFGSGSKAEMLNATQVLLHNANEITGVDFYLTGSEWNWSEWDVKNIVKQLSGNGKQVNIILNREAHESIDADLAWSIQRSFTDDVKWYVLEESMELANGGHPLMTLYRGTTATFYATSSLDNNVTGENWGKAVDSILVKSPVGFNRLFNWKQIDVEAIARESELNGSGISIIDNIHSELDVPVSSFGKTLLDLIESQSSLSEQLNKGIVSVEYFDKYIVSPLGCYLIVDFLSAIQNKYNFFDVIINTAVPKENNRPPACVADNFNSGTALSKYTNSLASYMGLDLCFNLVGNNTLPHGRYLTISLENGQEVKVIFDQGMGYWSSRYFYSGIKFDFDASEEQQLSKIKKWIFKAKAANHESYIVVK